MYTKARGDFIGRLTANAELRYTSGGTAVANFTLVTDDSIKNPATGAYENVPSFWDCQLWGKQAEKISQYLTKGKLIGLDGGLKIESWEQNGQKRMKVKISVQNVVFIAGNDNHAGGSQNAPQVPPRPTGGNPQHNPAQPSDGFEDEIPW